MNGKLVSVGLLVILSLGCTRNSKDDTATVTLQTPQSAGPSHFILSQGLSQSVQQSGDQGPFNGSITASSQINCYIVMVGGGEDNFNWCKDRSGVQMTTFGVYQGGVPAGQSISFDLRANSSKTFYLLGSRATNGACRSFREGSGPDRTNLAYFRLLDTKTVTLKAGETQIAMTVPSDLSALREMDQCQVSDVPGGGGGGGSSINIADLFGNGRDGDLTTVAPGSPAVNSTLSSQSALVGITSGLSGTKIMMASQRVLALPAANQIQTAGFGVPEFEPNDEVIWNVVAAWGDAGGPDASCGGGLFRGSWGTGRIVSTTSDTMTLDRNVTYSHGTLLHSNIAQTVTDRTLPFCRIIVTRIANYQSITVNHDLMLTPNMFTSTYDAGGIIAIKTRTLTVNSGLTLTIHADDKGFPGYLGKPGGSSEGYSTSPGGNVNVGNGGGAGDSAAEGGGGGGNGGVGGQSTMGINTVGQNTHWCFGPCAPWKDKKAHFGGAGGGANSSVYGKAGGGMVFLFAENVTGAGDVVVRANGVASATAGAGAGAGGSALAMVRTNGLSGAFSVMASGGDTISGNTVSGAGGGGNAEFYSCSASSATVTANKGAAVGGGSFEGSNGNVIYQINYTPLCQ